MTPEKIRAAIGIYQERLARLDIVPQKHPHDKLLESNWAGLQHLLAMQEDMRQFLDEGHIEKTFRWLGFTQGGLWFARMYTIGEMADHNRPDQPEERSKSSCATSEA